MISYLTLFFLLFFAGCTNYSAVKNFKNDAYFANALQATQKRDFIENDKIKFMFTATYLNPVSKEFNHINKSFIVSIFEVNENSIDVKEISAKLNDGWATSIKPLPKDHIMRDRLPLKNHWAKYFIIKFQENESLTQKLELSYKDSTWIELKFD